MNNVPPYLQSYPCLPTGSRVICDPPVMDTDEDYLILIPEEDRETIEDLLEQDGYVEGGSGHTYQNFLSYKNYEHNVPINILLTCQKDYFDRFSKATALAKALNLKEKSDRITLFEAVVRDSWPGNEKSNYIFPPGKLYKIKLPKNSNLWQTEFPQPEQGLEPEPEF